MGVTSIRFSTSPVRSKPREGDRRTTKKHGLQIRIMSMVHDRLGRPVGYNCTGGRQNYEWVAVKDLPARLHHLLLPEERAAL